MTDDRSELGEVLRLAHRRLGRRVAATLVGGLAVSALLGLGGEGIRRAVHVPPTTSTTPPVVIAAPVLTGGATSPRTVRLTWTEPDGGPARYVLFRDGAVIRTVTERRFDDSGLVPGRSYAYAVEAAGAGGTRSPKSTGITVTMPGIDPPSSLEARVSSGLVALAWEPSSDEGVVTYIVFRDDKQVGRVDAETSRYLDRSVVQARTYRYDVRAVDGAGHRSLPASVSVTTPDGEPPSAPTDLRATEGENAERRPYIHLEWTASTDNVGVTGYRVLRDGKEIGTTSGDTAFTDTAVDDNKVYSYKYTVQAVDAAGNRSKQSAPASATPSIN